MIPFFFPTLRVGLLDFKRFRGSGFRGFRGLGFRGLGFECFDLRAVPNRSLQPRSIPVVPNFVVALQPLQETLYSPDNPSKGSPYRLYIPFNGSYIVLVTSLRIPMWAI